MRDIYTLMFTAELFTKAKMWKDPKYLPTDEWINKNMSQKDIIMIPTVIKFIEKKSEVVLARGCGIRGNEFQLGIMKKFWR